jgi:hypothetical protein
MGQPVLMLGRRSCGASQVALARVPALAAGHVDWGGCLDAASCQRVLREYERLRLRATFGRLDGSLHAPLNPRLIAPQFGDAVERTSAAPARERA